MQIDMTTTAPSPAPEQTKTSPTTPRQASNSGQRIGPYILGKTLGVGSTGRVKQATHIVTGQKVAIKIISKSMYFGSGVQSKSQAALKLEREITILKLIRHPHILQIYDVYESTEELFLVLEHVDGGELFDHLVKKGRLSETEALYFFQQIVYAVEFCHSHLICHRDLKPENLLLDKDFNIKVADFGMANLQKPLTLLETSCGSPHYASPEIIRGEKYDGPTSDSWSCGVILFALVTGNLPFDDENMRRLLSKVKQGEYHIPDFVSPGPREIIQKLLKVNPKERWTLKDVMKHPWFHSREPKENLDGLRSPLEDDQYEQGFPPDHQFENDLLDALKLLGWTDRIQLLEKLQVQGKNAEKVYYNLLQKRKWEILENYTEEYENKYHVEGGPMRRAESFGIESPEPQRFSRRSVSEPYPKSPLSKSAPVEKIIAEEKIIRKPPPSVQTSSLEKVDSPSPSRAHINQAFQNLGLGTPKFHRKGTPIKDAGSPLISHQPKTSWFQNFFHFKPETFYMVSKHSLIDTIAILEPILNKEVIQYRLSTQGLIKCRLDSINADSTKPEKHLKFKIEIVPDTEPNQLRVQLQHQHGSFSAFQETVQKVLLLWNKQSL